jgi:hypothetical protein
MICRAQGPQQEHHSCACRCLQTDAIPDEEVLKVLFTSLNSDVPNTARNAAAALGALALCGPFCPLRTEDLVEKLLAVLSPLADAAAAATGGAAIALAAGIEALNGADEALVCQVVDALFKVLARGAGGLEDEAAAAAAVLALGCIAGGYGWQMHATHEHAARVVTQVLSFTVFLLSELSRPLEDILRMVLDLLPAESGPPGLWVAFRSPSVDSALTALRSAPGATASIACAAVGALVSLIEAVPQAEAEALSPVIPAILKACCDNLAGGNAVSAGMHGALVGSVAALPRVVAALQSVGLDDHVNVVLRGNLAGVVLAAAPDASVLVAALVSQASLLAQQTHAPLHSTPGPSAISAKSDVQAFLAALPAEVARGGNLPRGRFVQTAAPMVLATLLGTAAPLGSVRRACMAGPIVGLLQDPRPEHVDAIKGVVKELERCCLGGTVKLPRLSAWLLARCSRVWPPVAPDCKHASCVAFVLLLPCCLSTNFHSRALRLTVAVARCAHVAFDCRSCTRAQAALEDKVQQAARCRCSHSSRCKERCIHLRNASFRTQVHRHPLLMHQSR